MQKNVESDSWRPEVPGKPVSRTPFKQVMDCLTANSLAKAHELCTEFKFRPKLGQLLIASGRLSPADLDSMLLVHEQQELKSVPMGKLLVVAGLLTADELSCYFELQNLLKMPSRQQNAWGQTLVALNLLSQDQLNTALSDQLVTNMTLKETIALRGWLTPQMVEHLEAEKPARSEKEFAQTCEQQKAASPP